LTHTIVDAAKPLESSLELTVKTDPRYNNELIEQAIVACLINKDDGILLPENIGIEGPLYRSAIFHGVLSVPGTLAVHNIIFKIKDANGKIRIIDFLTSKVSKGELTCIFGIKPERKGEYFNFTERSFKINFEANG
jgi:hypothetical protein